MHRIIGLLLLCAVVLVAIPATFALDVGSDGSDGVLSPTSNVTIDLGLAASTSWNSPSPVPGKGVYDGTKWAVVFKYSSVNIPVNVTVTFKNHPSKAPVVWLVQGNVTIAGKISVEGGIGSQSCTVLPESGPGGWRAGKAFYTSGLPDPGTGRGPGGGDYSWQTSWPSYGSPGSAPASPTYGNPQVLPLVGGSGGGGSYNICGGGAGGAIMIASGGTISLQGEINADGGDSRYSYDSGQPGTGGAIRLIATTATGSGLLRARGGRSDSGSGRIRVEANTITLTDTGIPLYTAGPPTDPATIWPPTNAPIVRAVRLGGKNVPADPYSSLNNHDVRVGATNPVTLEIEAQNVPLDWIVEVRVVPVAGDDSTAQATLVSGNQALSQWTASLTLPIDTSTVQVRAHKP